MVQLATMLGKVLMCKARRSKGNRSPWNEPLLSGHVRMWGNFPIADYRKEGQYFPSGFVTVPYYLKVENQKPGTVSFQGWEKNLF